MTLFDVTPGEVGADVPGRARATDPQTSRDAAKLGKRGSQREQVLHALVDAGDRGLTAHEAWPLTSCMYPHVSGTRLGELVGFGLADATGETRRTPSGASATVYVITDHGRACALALRANAADGAR